MLETPVLINEISVINSWKTEFSVFNQYNS